jgi:S1-C subfamily serine protease
MVNSQAALAGIQSEDTITRIGGLEINNVIDVVKVINAHNVGDVVDVEFIRENQRLAGQMTLEKAPSAQPPVSMR